MQATNNFSSVTIPTFNNKAFRAFPTISRCNLFYRASCTTPKARSTSESSIDDVIEPQTCSNPTAVPPSARNNDALATSIFRSSPYDAAIFSLALPAVLALAADPLLAVVDTVFVGQIDSDALAALGINSALFTFSFVVFNFLSTATTPLIATALAMGDEKKAGKITLQALGVATILGVGLAGALIGGADQALAVMGADKGTDPQVFALAKQFLLIRACAAPAALLTTVGQGAFRGLQDMKIPLAITLGANAINLSLDIVLILGLGWGIKGAATATATAEWIAAISYLGLLYTKRSSLGGLDMSSAFSSSGNVDKESFFTELLPFFTAGGSVLMRTALLLGTKTLASATAARLGSVEVASHQVVMQLWLLSSLLIDSLAVAGQSLVAVEKGRGNDTAARDVSDRLLGLGVTAGVVLAAFFWASEPVLPRVFTNDSAVEHTVRSILPLAVAMLPVNAAVYVLDGCFMGARDFGWLAGAMGLAAAVGTGLLFSVHPLHLGLQGVWGALAALMIGRLATLMWRYVTNTIYVLKSSNTIVNKDNMDKTHVINNTCRYQQVDGPLPSTLSSSSSSIASSLHGSIDEECTECGDTSRRPIMITVAADDRDTVSGIMDPGGSTRN